MRSILATGLALTVAALLASCGARDATPGEAKADHEPTVTAVQPSRGDVVRNVTLSGDLVGYSEAALHAKVTGYLKSIAVDKGDTVGKGQVLAEIEVPELSQKLARARANLQVRQRTYERLRGVWKSDQRLVAREDVDIAEGGFQQAQAEVEELVAMVDYTHIVAPFGGVVTARNVDPGALIQAGGHTDGGASAGSGSVPVLRIADISRLRVYVYVPEEETSVVRRGQPATLRLREFPDHPFQGVVARFASSLDLSTRTMLTEVDLDNPNRELYPGMYADVTLELQRDRDVLRVPNDAVTNAGDDAFVWIVKDGALAKLPVVPGLAADGWREVRRGLAGDEQVVSPVGPGLAEGEHVRVVAAGGPPAVARAE